MDDKKQQTGICETCEKAEGIRRFPNIAEKDEALRMSYISCQPCFEAVWAGEN